MSNLLYLAGGWLSLLTRGSVLLQLLAILLVMLGYRSVLLRARLPRSNWRRLLALLGAITVLALVMLLFGWLGMPTGLINLASGLLTVWLGLSALRLLLRRVHAPEEVESYWRRGVVPLFVVTGLVTVVDQVEGLHLVSDIPLIRLFDQTLTLGSLSLLVILPYFLVVLSELPVFLLGEAMTRLAGMTQGNRKAFELLLRYALIGLGLLWLANQVGLNSTAIAAVAGGLSVGLGFGVKEVFSNFVSGLWLLFEGSVRPGDVIVYENDPCEVRHLGLRAATLWRDGDNALLLVPNQNFFTATTITYSTTTSLRRSIVVVGAHYRHEPEKVIELILEAVASVPRVLKEPVPVARISNYGESSVDYTVLYWINRPMDNGSIGGDVRRAIWHSFHANGIEIPFPQRVVHPAQSLPGDQALFSDPASPPGPNG
ncbi:MAG: mechanosensitive ion channel family protein [Synechococcaceae cyanobacterium]